MVSRQELRELVRLLTIRHAIAEAVLIIAGIMRSVRRGHSHHRGRRGTEAPLASVVEQSLKPLQQITSGVVPRQNERVKY
jgi:hypothetical protein